MKEYIGPRVARETLDIQTATTVFSPGTPGRIDPVNKRDLSTGENRGFGAEVAFAGQPTRFAGDAPARRPQTHEICNPRQMLGITTW
jgi:hypothetical protein